MDIQVVHLLQPNLVKIVTVLIPIVSQVCPIAISSQPTSCTVTVLSFMVIYGNLVCALL